MRVEDTDAERDREEWVEGIYSAMAWLGLTLDEGPFRQSDNDAAHDSAAQVLRRNGYLYYCDCTPAEIEARKGPARRRATTASAVIAAWSAARRPRFAFARRARA